jgi:hypothetical protein
MSRSTYVAIACVVVLLGGCCLVYLYRFSTTVSTTTNTRNTISTSNSGSQRRKVFPEGTPTLSISDYLVPLPTDWTRMTPSEGWLAQFRIPASNDDIEDALLTVHDFGAEFATSQQVLDHWRIDFARAADVRREVVVSDGGFKVTLEDVTGTYQPAMMPNRPLPPPRADWRMIVAVIKSPSGTTYFRLIGPEKTVGLNKDKFTTVMKQVQLK